MKPVAFIDLFSGLGGFTTGAINAGAYCILSVDSWVEANKVHLANHPDAPYKTMELGHPSHWKMFKRLVDFYKELGYHVHIHGSPPCQALSNASRRDAEEGMPLVLWYLDLVERCDPDSWSMENVVPVRNRLPEGTPSVILNSADFGVPQTRRRCFAGSGWEARPSHTKEEWVSVLDALPHIVDNLLMDSGRASAPTSGVNPRTGKKEGGSGPLFRTLSEPSYTILSSPRRIMKLEALGANANRSRDTILSEPSKTICGSGNQVGPRLFDHDSDKPQKVRSLTMPETLVLQGFPADYDMSAARTQKARWTMIGNAVPPPVAEAVIRGIHHGIHN